MIIYKPENPLLPVEQACDRAMAIALSAGEDVLLDFNEIKVVAHHKPVQFVLNQYHERRAERNAAAKSRPQPIVEESLT